MINTPLHYHLIGIGGCGMAGLAQMLKQKGFIVSGSDKSDSLVLDKLRALNIKIFIGHEACQIQGANKIIISTAINSNNPEILEAQRLAIPIIHRAQGLADLSHDKKLVLILGSHGKTTTTGFLISMLRAGNFKPSYAIGATYYETGLNAYLDTGESFIIEGDESDHSFRFFSPEIIILNNIDHDHLETYGHDLENLKSAYLDFIKQSLIKHPNLLVIFNAEDPHCVDLILTIKNWASQPRIKTYGGARPDAELSDIFIKNLSTEFKIKVSNHTYPFVLNMPGKHNAQNAAGAVLAGFELGLNLIQAQEGLKNYQGASRRCEVHGEFVLENKKFLLIEDYGHHPVEIKVTLEALRLAYPERRLVLVFQPHRYTRTRDLFEDFAKILGRPDVLVLLEIYAASEKKIENINSENLLEKIRAFKNNKKFGVLTSLNSCLETLREIIKPNDLVLIQGAGDIHGCVGMISRLGRIQDSPLHLTLK